MNQLIKRIIISALIIVGILITIYLTYTPVVENKACESNKDCPRKYICYFGGKQIGVCVRK